MKNKFSFLVLSALLMAGCSGDDNFIENITEPQSVSVTNENDTWSDRLTVEFTPSGEVAKYEYAIADSEQALSAFLDGTLDGIVTVDPAEARKVTFDGLAAATVYNIFVRGYDEQGNATPYAQSKVKTLDNGFAAATQYIGATSAGFEMRMSNDYHSFIYALGKHEDRDKFEAGTLAGTVQKEEIPVYVYNAFDLEPETEYSFFARGESRTGEPTKTYEIRFTTKSKAEAAYGDFSIKSLDVYYGEYAVTPNANCGKIVFYIGGAGDSDNVFYGDYTSHGDLMACLSSWADSGQNVTVSEEGVLNAHLATPNLSTDIPLEVYVLVYDKQGNPASVDKYEFSTPAYDNTLAAANILSGDVTDITSTKAKYTFTVDENTLGVVYDIVRADFYEEVTGKGSSDFYFRDLFMTNGQWWQYTAGADTFTVTEHDNAEPNTRYYLLAFPMNFNGVSDPNWGVNVFKKEFTTLP
jgi:hypothetical protein